MLHRLRSAQEIEGPMPAASVGAAAAAAHGNPSHSSLWGTQQQGREAIASIQTTQAKQNSWVILQVWN